MKRIPLNGATSALARRLVWFDSPSEALADPARFMAYAFARATHEEMNVLRAYLDEADSGRRSTRRRPASSIRARGPIGICASDAIPPRRCRCGDWDSYAPTRSRASTLATKSPTAFR
jgi:hypothetical protein